MADGTPQAARVAIAATEATCRPGPQLAEVADTAIPGGPPVRIYRSGTVAGGTIVHFHGGGWVTGGLGYADAYCRLLAATTGWRVVSVDYRLAPENPFPAAVDDALAAVDWASRTSEKATAALVLSGDSAGGNLAAVCAAAVTRDPVGGMSVVGQALVYPIVDAELSRDSYLRRSTPFLGADEMRWFFDHYCADQARRWDPRVSPLRADDGFAALPPTLVAVGGHDPLHDEGVAYATRVRRSGPRVQLLDFPALSHGYLQFTGVSAAATEAQDRIVAAVAALCADAAAL